MTPRSSDGRPLVRVEIRLTPRQREVIELMAKGYTNARIGEELGISLDGAKWHVSEILTVLDVDTREQAVQVWRKHSRSDRRFARALRSIAPATALRWFGGAAAVGVAAGLGLVAWAVLSNGGPPPSAPADPTVTAVATGSPTEAAASATPSTPGPPAADIVVYADEVRSESTGERSFPIVEVVTFDLDAGREVASFEVGGLHDFVSAFNVEVVGREVLVAFERRVTVYDFEGNEQRRLYEAPDDRFVTGALVSQDGQLVAIGTEGVDLAQDERSQLLVVDIASGSVVRTFPFERLTMTPLPVAWHADNSAIEFRGIIHKGGGLSPYAIARMDGTVVPHDENLVAVDSAGRRAAWLTGDGVFECHYGLARGRVVLTDLVSGETIDDLSVPGSVLLQGQWSPDGSELLLAAYEVNSKLPDGRPCWEWQSPRYFQWNEGGSLEAVQDYKAVLRDWEGEHYVEVECGDSVQERGLNSSQSITCSSVMQDRPEATLHINGEAIDEVRNAWIAGFVGAR